MPAKKSTIYRELADKCTSLTKFISIWRLSFAKGEFKVGKFLIDALDQMQKYDKTLVLSSRGFCKSMRCRMELAYYILTSKHDFKVGLISSTPDQAEHQTRALKQAIENNIVFRHLVRDLKPQAENLVKYRNHLGATIEIEPIGLARSIRGKHFRGGLVIIDDALRDATGNNVLTSANIDYINRTIKRVITPMIHSNTKVRVIGTPMSLRDFYYDQDYFKDFQTSIQPALDENDQSVFEELYTTDFLHARRKQIGNREFSTEYQCEPISTGDNFFDYEVVQKCVNKKLKSLDRYQGDMRVIAAADLSASKSSNHATHIVAFKIDNNDKLIQIFSLWLKGQPYTSQLVLFKQLIKRLNIEAFYIDNTNKTFSFAFERGEAPPELKELSINRSTKENMAHTLDTLFTHRQIELINDQRQIDQLMLVQADLDIRVNQFGHGDSFTSIGFCAVNYQRGFAFAIVDL